MFGQRPQQDARPIVASVSDPVLRNSDVLLAAGVMTILGMMVIPLPPPLIDLLVATNIAVAITILLVAMYTKEVLAFSVFPSLLLLVTLFRLAINVSSTRMILLQADAGEIIKSFGVFVVGGSVVVGIVVFMILLVIQFVVITNGAGRVAEVAARFTLDAMPGKQMSIDADLNAGIITEADARQRRQQISREADFYGAMDGASKFVKGDAIAAMIIVVINLVGGIAIGVMQRGLSPGEAVSTYALLTVGDGLVSQIPALLISTATGLIVTRAASTGTSARTSGVNCSLTLARCSWWRLCWRRSGRFRDFPDSRSSCSRQRWVGSDTRFASICGRRPSRSPRPRTRSRKRAPRAWTPCTPCCRWTRWRLRSATG